MSENIVALLLVPVGDVPSSDALRLARDSGVPVINIEKNTGSPPASYIHTEWRGSGIQLGNWVCENDIEFSNVLLPLNDRSQSELTFTSGFIHQTELCSRGKAKYIDLELSGLDDNEAVLSITEKIRKDTSINLVMGHSKFLVNSAVSAVNMLEQDREIVIVGHDKNSDVDSAFIENSALIALSASPVRTIAKAALDTVAAILDAEEVSGDQAIISIVIDK